MTPRTPAAAIPTTTADRNAAIARSLDVTIRTLWHLMHQYRRDRDRYQQGTPGDRYLRGHYQQMAWAVKGTLKHLFIVRDTGTVKAGKRREAK